MIPKRVTLENFLSFGPKQHLEFDDGEPLWVVGGPNGVGKSAVFDAITYCLFGAHRGGKGQGMDELVRHGENGFFVQFEFEFNGVGYQITRNHKLKGRPTARIEQQTAGEWKAITGINSATDVKGWSERTLGLPMEAFAASVLLRQGQADEILNATGSKRLETLKKIIAAERYEALSKRVHDTATKRATKLEDLQSRRDTMPAVTAEQLAEAQLKQDAAAEDRDRAEQEKAHAAERVSFAKQWAKHEDARRQLAEKVAEADARAADAGRIQADHLRLDELNRVLPPLNQLVPIRDTLAATETEQAAIHQQHADTAAKLAALTTNLEALRLAVATHRDAAAEHAKEAKRLQDEIAGRKKFLTAAEEVAELDAKVKSFDPMLDRQATDAAAKLAEAGAAGQTARDAKTRLDTLLMQAKEDQRRLANVEAGVPCSRCGQVVTAEHAEKERAEIAETIRRLTADLASVTTQVGTAEAAVKTAKSSQDQLATVIRQRDQSRQRLADRQRDLEAFGGTSDVAQLRHELAGQTLAAEKSEHARNEERTKQERHEAELKIAEPTFKPMEKQVREFAARLQKLDTQLAADTATCAALASALSAEWAATMAAELQQHAHEQQRLASSGVAEEFRLWQQDATRREGWAEQLREIAKQIAAIPETARVPVVEAERLQKVATDAAKLADTAFGVTHDDLANLTRQAEALATLKKQIAVAEAEARVHKRLDELLGKKNLQRELVRTAETEIVRLANDTVRNLSNGDLSIELDHSEDGGDEAFALKVRREDSPPIDVAYLSGSQKFRVAIAVALAIGRFAAGQARPLECVIIDEGFGSLDKDGLQATAEELNNLKQHLRRIILVSHQEDFTSHFPVVYRLHKGENGTIAEKERRG
ncbi:AAA family ATPase [Limnoglobus roseus]|uniref:SMC family ATPase n=1 Tax=Limnoglobus roseus TaxID=2598579 RepID=A0A5C1A5S7_9BACT|nr:SMC family ATPase [Limnoglobus roseus]QEL13336.1 SMC family ATPase [Limnoglobus roseus]